MRNHHTQIAKSVKKFYSENPVKFIEEIPDDAIAMPICRVSDVFQDYNGNLQDQESHIRNVLKQMGIEQTEAYYHVGKGKDIEWLRKLTPIAKKNGRVFVMETMNRFMRPLKYDHAFRRNAKYTEDDFKRLRDVLDGVRCFSLLDPNATESEQVSFQTIRGITEKSKIDIPTTRDRYREKWMIKAIMMRQEGHSLRDIAFEISRRSKQSISHVSIMNWLAVGMTLPHYV